MKKLFLILIISLFLTQCNDGDFDLPSFVFENNISNCSNLIVVNIGVDDSEALILNIDEDNTDDLFFKTEMTDISFDLTNKISYRVFDGDVNINYFCQDIPPTSPKIVNEWNGDGILIVNNTIIKDDEDGILLEIGSDSDNPIDTDGDEIPNYIDIDDDNDGVLSKNEINIDDEGNAIFIDTDGDNTPDYLDIDDDGDGVNTINEFTTDSDGNEIADYLDFDTTEIQEERPQISNKYTLKYTTIFIIENMHLLNNNGNAINYSNYEYGVKAGSIIIEN